MFSTRMNAGCNLICTALHHTFNRLFEEHVPAGTQPFIDHVTCQVDNCGSETRITSSSATSGPLLVVESSAASPFSSCLWVIPILRSIRRFPGEIRVPWCVRRKKVCSFVLSLIPSILYTVSSLNVHHLRHDQSTFHLAPCCSNTYLVYAYPPDLLALLSVRKIYMSGVPCHSLRRVPSNLPLFTCIVCLSHR